MQRIKVLFSPPYPLISAAKFIACRHAGLVKASLE